MTYRFRNTEWDRADRWIVSCGTHENARRQWGSDLGAYPTTR